MAKDDYTNREINVMFNDIKEALERIEVQVIKTNGRVTTLEFWRASVMAKVSVIVTVIGGAWAYFAKH